MIALTPEGAATTLAALVLIAVFMAVEIRRRRAVRDFEQWRVRRLVAEITTEATMHGHASRGRSS